MTVVIWSMKAYVGEMIVAGDFYVVSVLSWTPV